MPSDVPSDYWMNQQKQQLQGTQYEVLEQRKERDPHGIPPNEPGAKLDAGKDMPYQILRQFPLALGAVVAIGSFGARKYSMGGWQSVPQASERYGDAQFRHALKSMEGEAVDPDSGFYHLAHEAWNVLARLELFLREKKNGRITGEFKGTR